MPKPHPSEFRDDVARAARDREPGVTIEQIAKGFRVHPITLQTWLRRADLRLSWQDRRIKRLLEVSPFFCFDARRSRVALVRKKLTARGQIHLRIARGDLVNAHHVRVRAQSRHPIIGTITAGDRFREFVRSQVVHSVKTFDGCYPCETPVAGLPIWLCRTPGKTHDNSESCHQAYRGSMVH